jgi:hypothetical protein
VISRRWALLSFGSFGDGKIQVTSPPTTIHRLEDRGQYKAIVNIYDDSNSKIVPADYRDTPQPEKYAGWILVASATPVIEKRTPSSYA